jgi:RNA polymerase sigma-70 factor (ECF subfamily)
MLPDSTPNARLEELVRQYGRLIRNVISRIAGRAAPLIGEDIEQEIVLALWRQINREQTIEHPASYIYRAAVRETVRQLQRETARRSEPLSEELSASVRDSGHDPHAALAAKDLATKLQAAIDHLAPDRRRAVRAHLAGFEVAEIMQMTSWSYQKTRNLIARGIADLRKALREEESR